MKRLDGGYTLTIEERMEWHLDDVVKRNGPSRLAELRKPLIVVTTRSLVLITENV